MTCGRRKVTGGPYTLTTDSILTESSTNDCLRLTMTDMTRSSGHIMSDMLTTDKTGFQKSQRNPASFKVFKVTLAVCNRYSEIMTSSNVVLVSRCSNFFLATNWHSCRASGTWIHLVTSNNTGHGGTIRWFPPPHAWYWSLTSGYHEVSVTSTSPDMRECIYFQIS